MQYAAKLADVDNESLQTSLVKLSKNMAAAASGASAQSEAFAQLRISTANSNGSLRDVDAVLLDVAMHLHPKWQRILVNGLRRAFPKVQFVTASHSPQILGELSPNEIILLHTSGISHPRVSYGLSSSEVLEEIMEATARTKDVEEELAQLFAHLEKNDLEAAKTVLEHLKSFAPDIPELAGAESLLKRKEILGR